MNVLDSLLQGRLLWKLASNEDGITHSVSWLSKDWTAEEWGFACRQVQVTFQLSKAFLWILCPNKPHIQNVRGSFPRNIAARGLKLNSHLDPVLNFNNEWKYTSTPHTHVHDVIPHRHRGMLSNLLLHTVSLGENCQMWKKSMSD